MSTISSDDLRAILAGTVGVTPGPWSAEPQTGRGAWIKNGEGHWCALSCGDDDAQGVTNAAHIARLDPQTVAAICRELLSLREDGDVWTIYPPSADQAITVTRDEVKTELEAILSGGWDLRTEAALHVAIQAIAWRRART